MGPGFESLRVYHFEELRFFRGFFCYAGIRAGIRTPRVRSCSVRLALMRSPTSLRSLGMLSLHMPVYTDLCRLTILSPSGKKQAPGLFFIPQPCAPTTLWKLRFIPRLFLLCCRDSNPTGSVLLRKACAYALANFAAVTRNAKPANAGLHRPLHANHSLAFGQKTIPRTVFYPSALRAYHNKSLHCGGFSIRYFKQIFTKSVSINVLFIK